MNDLNISDAELISRSRPGIYAITHIASGKQYIGQAFNITHRWAMHRYELRRNHHHSPHLQRAWNKYGPDAFTFSVLEYVEVGDDLRGRLTEREQWHMDARWEVKHSCEYNIAPAAGSMLGFRHSPESIERVRLTRIGRPAWNKGVSATPETREKMRQRKLGYTPKPSQRAGLERGYELARSGVRSERQKEATEALRQWSIQQRGKPATAPYTPERLRGLYAKQAEQKAAAQEGRYVLTERQQAANAARKGRPLSEKQCASYAARRGQKQSPEQIAKRVATTIARGHTRKGQKFSEAHRQALREVHRASLKSIASLDIARQARIARRRDGVQKVLEFLQRWPFDTHPHLERLYIATTLEMPITTVGSYTRQLKREGRIDRHYRPIMSPPGPSISHTIAPPQLTHFD